jgi:thiol-disulfide isomerase/thioredoxin
MASPENRIYLSPASSRSPVTAYPGRRPPAAAVSAAATGATADSGAEVGTLVPPVTATALQGQRVVVPAGKPTALFCFAGWCSTCLPEARALDRLEREMGDRVSVVAVDVDPSDDAQTIQRFLRSAGDPRYPVVHDKDGALVRAFGVTALDVTVITDAGGSVVYRDAAPTREGQLRSALTKAGVR